MTELVVIGAGVAGLVCAALARAQGASVTVVEAGALAGGLWKSTAVDLGGQSYRLDAGLRLPVPPLRWPRGTARRCADP